MVELVNLLAKACENFTRGGMCWKVDTDFAKGNEQDLGFAATEARDNEEIMFVKGVLKSRKWERGNAWSTGALDITSPEHQDSDIVLCLDVSGVGTASWWQNEEGGFGRICTERRTQKLGYSQ